MIELGMELGVSEGQPEVLCALPNPVVEERAATSDTTMQLGMLASPTVTSCAKATTRR
jgi:hypothetical protein